jgi:hypothetical protein
MSIGPRIGDCSLILRSSKLVLHSGNDLPSFHVGHVVHMNESHENVNISAHLHTV